MQIETGNSMLGRVPRSCSSCDCAARNLGTVANFLVIITRFLLLARGRRARAVQRRTTQQGDAMRFMLGLAAGLVLLTGCQPAEQKSTTEGGEKPAAAAQSPVERGKYLTLAGGCNDCHTPKTFGPNGPEADMNR